MAEFRKYSEIENHYNFKIDLFLNNANLNNMKFIVQNKMDGSNISFIFTEQGHAKLASRNQYLGALGNVNFMGIDQVLKEAIFKDFAEYWMEKAKKDSTEYQFYGEIFGPGIQNRVNYGPKKNIQFFDMRVNGIWVPQEEFFGFILDSNITLSASLIVPTIRMVDGITEALNVCCDFKDPYFLDAEGENWSEGIVIKPFRSVIYDRYGERLIIKKKSDRFSENKKRKGPKEHKEKDPLPEGLITLSDEFLHYINENRVLSCFSKEGRIENMKGISKYLPLIMEDAMKDFAKDKGITEFGKEERKALGNTASKEIVDLLKKAMLGDF